MVTRQLPESTQYLTRNFSRPVVVALAQVFDSLVEYEHMDLPKHHTVKKKELLP